MFWAQSKAIRTKDQLGKFRVKAKGARVIHTRERLASQVAQRSRHNPGDSLAFATVSGLLGPKIYVSRSENAQRY